MECHLNILLHHHHHYLNYFKTSHFSDVLYSLSYIAPIKIKNKKNVCITMRVHYIKLKNFELCYYMFNMFTFLL